MTPRLIEEHEIPEVMKWYTAQGFEMDIPLVALPSRGSYVDDLACAWLYQSDSALGWVGFPVINPDANKARAFKALDLIFDHIISLAEDLDMKVLTATFGHKSLKRLSVLKNFIEGDTNISNFWRSV